MGIINFDRLEEYLNINDVIITGNYFKKENRETEIESQIDTIIALQKILMGYHSVESGGIGGEIGKRIDKIFVMIKKLEINNKDFKYKKEILERCFNGLKALEYVNYKDIFKRGMLRDEITIERVDFENLRVNRDIEIGKIKKVAFNIIEEDFINFMLKEKKYRKKDELKDYIREYVIKARLTKESEEYINRIIDIPEESLRYMYKFRWEKEFKYDEFYLIAERELNF